MIVSGLRKSFGGKPVLRDVNFTVERGSIVGVVGPSGVGKSVLLKILGGVLEPDSGNIDWESAVGESHKNEVGFLFQEGALFDSMTVIENVAFPLLVKPQESGALGLSSVRENYSQAMERAFSILTQVGLAKAYKKVPGQLSGGMRRRVGIARALVANPELVLLDDPTGGLDPVAASVIIELIKELHRQHSATIFIVSHDIRRLLPNVERVIALFEGQVACSLPPRELVEKAPEEVVKFLATRFDFSNKTFLADSSHV